MNREFIADTLIDVCQLHGIDTEGQLAFNIYSKKEMTDNGYDDATDSPWGGYEWCIIYNDNPDYCLISDDVRFPVISQIISWFHELKIGTYGATA